MIPEFDGNGNLPPGIHYATFQEVVERFKRPISRKRRNLTTNLVDFHNFIKDHAIMIFVDGSYVTSKLGPRDVDLIVVLPTGFDFTSQVARRLNRLQRNRKNNRLHIFAFAQGLQDYDIQRYLHWFTHAKQSGNPKGIVCMELGQ